MRRNLLLLVLVVGAVLAAWLLDRGGQRSGDDPAPDAPKPAAPAEGARNGARVAEDPVHGDPPQAPAGGATTDRPIAPDATTAGSIGNPSHPRAGTGPEEDVGADAPTLAGRPAATAPPSDEDPRGEAEERSGATVVLRIVSKGAEALEGARVELVDASGRRQELVADHAGDAHFAGVASGRARIDARLAGWVSVWVLELDVPKQTQKTTRFFMEKAVEVRGFVRAAEGGGAIAGARVMAVAGGRVHESQGWMASSRGRYATVETDASGAFMFSDLPRGEVCTLAVLAPGFTYAAHGFRPSAEDGLEPLEIRLERGGKIVGVVRSASGEPVAGARLHAYRETDSHLARYVPGNRVGRQSWSLPGISDAEGRFEIIGAAFEERWVLGVAAKGHARPEDLGGIVVSAATPEAYVELRLGAMSAIRVRVVDESGRPVARGRVTFRSAVRGEARGNLDEGGTAVLENVPTGEGTLLVRSKGFSSNRTPVTVLVGEPLDVDVKLDPAPGEPGVTVKGRAVDDLGNAIADLSITASSPRRPPSDRAKTDNEGRFTLEGVRAGPLTLSARGKGYDWTRLDVEAPAEDVRLVVPRSSRLRGRLELSVDAERPDLFSVALTRLDRPSGGGSSHPFGDGSFEEPVHADAHYRIQICGETFAPWSREVTTTPGETLDLGVIRVESGIELAGVLLDPRGEPVAGAAIEVELSFIALRKSTTDAEGRWRLFHLPTGKLEVKVLAEGHPEQIHSIEATSSRSDVSIRLRGAD